jgi:hypothetical protein
VTRRYCKISGVTIVSCDHVRHPSEKPWCTNEFRSASVRSVIPAQLGAAKWTTRVLGRTGEKIVQDLCPDHPVRPRMEIAALAAGGSIDPPVPSGSGGGSDPPSSRFL